MVSLITYFPLRRIYAVSSLLAVLLAGCGSSDTRSDSPSGRAVFLVKWPERSEKSRLIPAGTNSIYVIVYRNTEPTADGRAIRVQGSSQASISLQDLPVGDLTIVATADPGLDSSLAPLAKATAPLVIQPSQTTTITLTLDSTIDHIDISPSKPSIAVSDALSLFATARNATGDVLLIPPSNMLWSSANLVAARVDVNGTVSGIAQGTSQITAKDADTGKAASVIITVVAGGLQAGSPWPKALGSARNTSQGQTSGPSTGQVAWTFSTTGRISGGCAVAADGSIFFGSGDSNVYALTSSGALKWSFHTGQPVTTTPAIGSDGTVYVGSESLYALTPTGSLKWKVTPNFGGFTSPAIANDGTVYSESVTKLWAISSSGQVKWKGSIDSAKDVCPSLAADDTVYAVDNVQGLYAFNRDGSLKWKYTAGGPITGTAVGTDGAIWIGSESKGLGFSGGVERVQPTGEPGGFLAGRGDGNYTAPVIGSDGFVYVAASPLPLSDQTAKLYGFSPSQMVPSWTFDLGDEIAVSNPVRGSNGTIYVGTYSGKLYAVDTNGNLIWKVQAGGPITSSPALDAMGRVLLGSEDSSLYTFR